MPLLWKWYIIYCKTFFMFITFCIIACYFVVPKSSINPRHMLNWSPPWELRKELGLKGVHVKRSQRSNEFEEANLKSFLFKIF